MGVLRQFNWLGQERIDVPHLRSLESSIAADFDVLAGRAMAVSKPLVVRGFTISTAGAVGAAANNLTVIVADSILMNVNATESGSFFWVPASRAPEVLNATTNPVVTGSFTANQTNFVGVDIIRSADATTTDLVKSIDAGTLAEISKNVPLGRTLNYRFVISTSSFSSQPNLVPIAKVITNASNNVTSVIDARNLMFRVGSGGDFPNRSNAFSFPGGRNEDQVLNVFSGGDKAFNGMKDWVDAITTRVWEIGGGQWWYGPTADRNVKLTANPATVFTLTTGDNWEFVAGNLHWQGIRLVFDNSNGTGVFSNDIKDQTTNSPGLTDLVAGQCIYVDVDRTQTLSGGSALQPVKASLQTLGTPVVPGSRFILAWRDSFGVFTRDNKFSVGTAFPPATPSALGSVQLTYAAGTPATPLVAPQDANGVISNTATAGNNPGFAGTGLGTGPGVRGTGGATSGAGLAGTGGGPNGPGTTGTGTGTGAGVSGTGGGTSGTGVLGTGGGPNGIGVTGQGTGTGTGGTFTGGASNANGAIGNATGTGQGLRGLGSGIVSLTAGHTGVGVFGAGFGANDGGAGAYNNAGVFGQGGTSGAAGVVGFGDNGAGSGGIGVIGTGTGSQVGVQGTGGGVSGTGVAGIGGATNGIGVFGQGTGSGAGVQGNGGVTNAFGGNFTGGGTNGGGVNATGVGTGAGVVGNGGNGTNAPGVWGLAGTGSNAAGVRGDVGSALSIAGVFGRSLGFASIGVYGTCDTNNGIGVQAQATSTGALALQLVGNNVVGSRGAMNFTAQTNVTNTGLQAGDLFWDGTNLRFSKTNTTSVIIV